MYVSLNIINFLRDVSIKINFFRGIWWGHERDTTSVKYAIFKILGVNKYYSKYFGLKV